MTGPLTLKQAQEAIRVITDAASQDGKPPVVVAVADPHGDLVALARMDGATQHSVRMASNKAYTAAQMKRDTGTLGDVLKNFGGEISWWGEPRYTAFAGGIVIAKAGAVIGALGVSGRAPHEDLELAKKALEHCFK